VSAVSELTEDHCTFFIGNQQHLRTWQWTKDVHGTEIKHIEEDEIEEELNQQLR
jgi:hypothetical protein